MHSKLDFLGGPVIMTSPSNAGNAGLILGQGAKILQASGANHTSPWNTIKQKQYVLQIQWRQKKWSTSKKKKKKKNFKHKIFKKLTKMC